MPVTGVAEQERVEAVGRIRSSAERGRSPLLTRIAAMPLLAPTDQWWENRGVFNPGVAEGDDHVIHILYRAQGRDGISRLGYARTRDGLTIDERMSAPVFEPALDDPWERLGTEDPRLVLLENTFYVVYTAVSLYEPTDPHARWFPPGERPWRLRVSLALTEDFRSFARFGIILPSMDNKDAVLFPERIGGRYLLLHRLPPDIWLASSADLRTWEDHKVVLRTRPALWDEHRVGAGTPPVRTDAGWLMCYHGADHHNVYRAGFVLLDTKDPSKVLARSAEPVLEPTLSWEVKGQVSRVVFPTGMVIRGDVVLVYYGAADRVVGVARGSLSDILASLA